MEAAGKDSEEDTLQMAFKKLRVDAESRLGLSGVSDSSRGASRVSLDGIGAKSKLACPKDNWHGCSRKSSRGSSRSQRRRRSKSPILHPPKFTYCSGGPPGSSLKQQRLAPVPPDVRPPADGCGPVPAGKKESCPPVVPDHGAPPLVFGSCFEAREEGDGAEGPRGDFRALSELRGGAGCSDCGAAEPAAWNGVEVYSFTGLRDVISECEGSQRERGGPARDAPRTVGSPRSCSEQARGFVDDITIEDLSGYMEFYLYIPKKMSHMAEMMYT